MTLGQGQELNFIRCLHVATFKSQAAIVSKISIVFSHFPISGDGNDMNPALPDTSMKLGRYVYKHELFEIFSLANQNYSNIQDGGSKFQDGCQNNIK